MASIVAILAIGALTYSEKPPVRSQGNLGYEAIAPSVPSLPTLNTELIMRKASQAFEASKGVSLDVPGNIDTSTGVGAQAKRVLDIAVGTANDAKRSFMDAVSSMTGSGHGGGQANNPLDNGDRAQVGGIKGNPTHNTFETAKRLMYKRIYYDHQITFYAKCKYSGHRIHPQSCGLKVKRDKVRSGRTEAEHIVPAWELAHKMPCWKKGGREYCKETSADYVRMSSDLYNLVPSVGELNASRSNYPFGIVYGERRDFGNNVDFEVRNKVAEPREDVRGDIARIYFYMMDAYHLQLSTQQYNLFQAWDKADPVDSWERTRAARIERVQGNRNPHVQ